MQQQQHSVVGVAGCIAVQRAEGQMMEFQLRQSLTSAKAKVGQVSHVVRRWPVLARRLWAREKYREP